MGRLFLKTQDVSELDNALYEHKNYPVWLKTGTYSPAIFHSYEDWVKYMLSRDFDKGSIEFLAGDYN